MKILQVTHGFPPKQIGGTQLYVRDLSRELCKLNEVHIFYPRYESGRWGISHFPAEDLVVHELSMPLGLFRLRFRATKLRSSYLHRKTEQIFAELLNMVKPDIIHVQHLLYLSASIIQVAKRANIPVVLSLHDYWFICPLINLLKFNNEVCEGPSEDCRNCFACWNQGMADAISDFLAQYNLTLKISRAPLNVVCKTRNPLNAFVNRTNYMKSLLSSVDKIIAPSKFLMNLFINFGVSSDKIIYSDKGYDLIRFKGFEKSRATDRERLVFGYVGGMAKYKGLDLLIQAFNKIDRYNVELRIYGDYDLSSKSFLMTRSRIINPNIRFVGRYEDVRKPYSEIDALVFPSICYENRPLVLTESVIAKIPVIASNLGSIPELIEDGKNGLLFKSGSQEDLYKKLMTIVENPDLLNNLQGGKQQVKSIQNQAEEINKIYHDIQSGKER